jgi:CRP/FNR family transcriptional regulator, cyclic AMP receptor protein
MDQMVYPMKTLKSLRVQDKCDDCKWKQEHFFCSLPEPTLSKFSEMKITHVYPRGTMLFVEGQEANGVHVLCAGRVKLSTYSEDGRSMIVRIAEPGEVLGLSACVTQTTYESSAQVIEDCQVNFIRIREFLGLLNTQSPAALNAIRDLSSTYHKAHSKICSLGLSASVSDKLAKLFLDWYERYADGHEGAHIPMDYTHEEIAEMIGTSRETVTRLLKKFRTRKLITISRTDLYIPDKRKLEATVGNGRGEGHD